MNLLRARVMVTLSLLVCSAALAAAEEPRSRESGGSHTTQSHNPPKSLSAAAWDELGENIRSHGKSHRGNAVAALAVIGARPDSISLLKEALHDHDSTIRRDAALALGELQVYSARGDLRALLDDDAPDVGYAAATALEKMGDHSGREVFIATLDGDRKGDGLIKSGLKSNMQKYRDPKYLAFVGAKEAAGAFFGPLSMGVVVAQELMKDRTASARANSANLLAKDPSPDAVNELKQALQDKNWAVRVAAAGALAKSPGKVAPETFEPLLIDDKAAVRTIAAAAIIRLTEVPKPKDLHWREGTARHSSSGNYSAFTDATIR